MERVQVLHIIFGAPGIILAFMVIAAWVGYCEYRERIRQMPLDEQTIRERERAARAMRRAHDRAAAQRAYNQWKGGA